MRRFHYDTIDSTSSEGRRLAAAHPGERLLVTAATQSAGRGRHGRFWQSPRGGAWLSIVWPLCREVQAYATVSLAAAVAVRRALVQVTGDAAPRLCIKWPNDLLLDDAKVAGILCEQFAGRGGGATSGDGILVVGVGVNVDFEPSLLAGDLRHPATTLRAAVGRSLDLEKVVAAVCEEVVWAVEAFEGTGLNKSLLDELRENLAYLGSVRSWKSPAGVVTGRILGVDNGGRLLLECGAGQVACEVGELVTGT